LWWVLPCPVGQVPGRLRVLEELMQKVQVQLPCTWQECHEQAVVVETLLRLTVEAVMPVLPREVQQRVSSVHAGYEVVRWRKPSFEHEEGGSHE
jgi:hypothetical protein